MKNQQPNYIDQTPPAITGVNFSPEAGRWAIQYDDGSERRLNQPTSIVTNRIEQLDTPVAVKRRIPKTAMAVGAIAAFELALFAGALVDHEGDLVEAADASANVQISAFFDSLDALEDFLK